jgi:hypothetical protein
VGLSDAQGQGGAWRPRVGPGPGPGSVFFFIIFFGIFGFAYVLHFFLGVSCFVHVLV